MRLRKRLVALCLATGFVLGTAGPALAARADGVCGGLGTWNPVTQQCEE